MMSFKYKTVLLVLLFPLVTMSGCSDYSTIHPTGAVPADSSSDTGKVVLSSAQLELLAARIEAYQMDTGGLPSNLHNLLTAPANTKGWLGPYAKDDELIDPWGSRFQYSRRNDGFELKSYGSDRQSGGNGPASDVSIIR